MTRSELPAADTGKKSRGIRIKSGGEELVRLDINKDRKGR